MCSLNSACALLKHIVIKCLKHVIKAFTSTYPILAIIAKRVLCVCVCVCILALTSSMTSFGDATLMAIPFFASDSSTSSYPSVRLDLALDKALPCMKRKVGENKTRKKTIKLLLLG